MLRSLVLFIHLIKSERQHSKLEMQGMMRTKEQENLVVMIPFHIQNNIIYK